MPVESLTLRTRRWLWYLIGGGGLFTIGLIVWMATAGRLETVPLPTPILVVVFSFAGAAALPVAWSFLRADYVLRVSDCGVEGWALPAGFRSISAQKFKLSWDEVVRVDVVVHSTRPHARITTRSDEQVFLNPVHISGFSRSDADVLVGLIEKGRARGEET